MSRSWKDGPLSALELEAMMDKIDAMKSSEDKLAELAKIERSPHAEQFSAYSIRDAATNESQGGDPFAHQSEKRKQREETAASRDRADLSQLSSKRRINEQCFLFDSLEFFAKQNGPAKYRHVIPVIGNPVTATNKLTKTKGHDQDLFFQLKPSAMAMLVPKIRLFLIKYKGPDDKLGRYQELLFEDHITNSAVDSIFKNRRGRGAAAGIKNFTYEFDGKDPATTDSMIKANLTLFFTDFDTVVAHQRGPTAEEREYFGNRADEDYAKPRFLDLIMRSEKQITDDAGSRRYNSKFYKIKAIVGWAVPPNNSSFDSNDFFKDPLGKPTGKELRKLIKSMDLTLDLHMIRHNIEFMDDGRIELRIDYRAAIEGSFRTDEANILLPQPYINLPEAKSASEINSASDIKDTAQMKIASSREAVKELLRLNRQSLINQNELISSETDTSESDKELKIEIENEITRLETLIQAAEESFKAEKYKRILERLKQNNRIMHVDLNRTKMYQYFLSGPEFRAQQIKARGGKSLASADPSESGYQVTSVSPESVRSSPGAIVSGDSVTDAINGIRKATTRNFAAARATTDSDQEIVSKVEVSTSNEIMAVMNASHQRRTALLDKDKYRLSYVYLGDLIAAAASIVAENGHPDNIKILLGEFDYEVPMTTTVKKINLADIPIALDHFVGWYINKVIKTDRKIYYMADFVKDILTELVYSALGEQCFKGSGAVVPMISMLPITTVLKKDNGNMLSSLTTTTARGIKYYDRITVDDMRKKIVFPDDTNAIGSPGNEEKFLFIYASARGRKRLSGDYKKDRKLGIPHFGIGQDAGIVKKIKFQRIDTKYLTEARVVDDKQAGMGQLFEKYNATIDLYGCPLFRNGQFVYIDPTTVGVDRETAQILGLGGYYIITTVEGDLTRDGYETRLKCTFNHSPHLIKQADKTSSPQALEGASPARAMALMNKIDEQNQRLVEQMHIAEEAYASPHLETGNEALLVDPFEILHTGVKYIEEGVDPLEEWNYVWKGAKNMYEDFNED